MQKMREDQIPGFVTEILATGCDMLALENLYVIADRDLPMAIQSDVARILGAYGERGHLEAKIASYLHSIGKSYPRPSED